MRAKPFKIGAVSVRPMSEGKWLLRYHDPASQRDVRRRFIGIDQKELEAIATHINHEILAQGGYLPEVAPSLPTIEEGLAEAIKLANTRLETQRNRAREAKRFVDWLALKHPRVSGWDQLRRSMVQEFVLDLESQGLAFDTVRLAIAPIKIAWRHIAESYPDLVKPLARIKQTPPPPRTISCLEPEELAALLEWLRIQALDIWPMACLQSLAGLRMLEAAALRIEDLDLADAELTVCDTGRHKPKTTSSWRTIPLCGEVTEALQQVVASQSVKPPTGEIFLNRKGNPWIKDAISLRWQRLLPRAARALGMPRIAEIPARKMRACFSTLAGRLGVPDRLLKAYMGHSAGDVLGAHYRRIDVAELRTVSDAMNGWRSRFLQDGNILATNLESESQMVDLSGVRRC